MVDREGALHSPMSLTKPFLPVLAIATAVLLVHLALLRSLPTLLQVQAPVVVHALTTRTIDIPPVPAAVATPRPAAKKPARKAATAPLPDNAPATTVAAAELPEPVPVDHSADSTATPAPPPPEPEPPAAAPVDAPPQPPLPEPAASAPVAPVPLTHATLFNFPDPVRLLYALSGEAKKMHYNANGELLWKQDGHSYEATLQASMLFLGSRTRTSTGNITPEGLAPQRFSDKWRTEVAAHFDQPNRRASFSANTPSVELQTAAQDQLSVILQIAGILAAEPAKYPPAATLAIQTIGPKDADLWVFTVEGPEKIYVPNGGMDTLKLTRKPRKEFDQKVEIWLAPAMGYLPARLKITNANGDYIDQQLRGVEKP